MGKRASFYFLERKAIVRKSGHEFWRGVADAAALSPRERLRVEYKNNSSGCVADLLYRLRCVVGQPIENLQTDNGSEFAWEFARATARLDIQRDFSRVKTPQDNSEVERFNQTLEYEWLYDCNLSLDPEELNRHSPNGLSSTTSI